MVGPWAFTFLAPSSSSSVLWEARPGQTRGGLIALVRVESCGPKSPTSPGAHLSARERLGELLVQILAADYELLFLRSRNVGIYLGTARQGLSGNVRDARPSPCPPPLRFVGNVVPSPRLSCAPPFLRWQAFLPPCSGWVSPFPPAGARSASAEIPSCDCVVFCANSKYHVLCPQKGYSVVSFGVILV